jgi:hypothetical protein
MMARPPTEKQLTYLERLGYDGTPPSDSFEASTLIDALKNGRSVKGLSAQIRKNRNEEAKGWIDDQKDHKKDGLELAADPYTHLAGFLLSDKITCKTMGQYAGAFLPVQVALKWPDLLPPGRQCKANGCDLSCEYEDVETGDFISRDKRMIIKPGKMVSIRRHKSQKNRGAKTLLLIVVALLIYWFLHRT